MIETDIVVIGAGPTGLFTVFEAGLLGMRCHLIDSLTKPGGQCSEIYPNKPIYDIPAYPEILAGELVEKLLEQIKPFNPSYSLGETAEKLSKNADKFLNTTDIKTKIHRVAINNPDNSNTRLIANNLNESGKSFIFTPLKNI